MAKQALHRSWTWISEVGEDEAADEASRLRQSSARTKAGSQAQAVMASLHDRSHACR